MKLVEQNPKFTLRPTYGLWTISTECISHLTCPFCNLAREMLDAGIVDARPYAALVAAYGKAGLSESVDNVLKMMDSAGVQLNTVLYNTLINVHSKAKAPEEARAVLQLMKSTGESGCLCLPWNNEHSNDWVAQN